VLALAWAAVPTAAQSTGDGFLFKAPAGAVTVRGGLNRASAGSDVFTFVTRELTLDRRDFRAMAYGADVGISLTPRLGVLFGVSVARSNAPSEFRDWLDNRDLPIEQTTALLRVPITASVKVYLAQPGRSVGRFAWIPARYAPYVGAGGGIMRYRLQQTGDFIDFADFRVFYDKYESKGTSPMAQAFAGVDISIHPRFALTTEARYEWASARLSTDFSGFDPIDLSGVSLTAGFSIRY
jgi:hypothetical protein